MLDCQVDVDKDYIRLRTKEGLEFALDPRKLGLVTNCSGLELAPHPPVGDARSSPIVDLTMDEAGTTNKTMAEELVAGPPGVENIENPHLVEKVEEGEGPVGALKMWIVFDIIGCCLDGYVLDNFCYEQ